MTPQDIYLIHLAESYYGRQWVLISKTEPLLSHIPYDSLRKAFVRYPEAPERPEDCPQLLIESEPEEMAAKILQIIEKGGPGRRTKMPEVLVQYIGDVEPDVGADTEIINDTARHLKMRKLTDENSALRARLRDTERENVVFHALAETIRQSSPPFETRPPAPRRKKATRDAEEDLVLVFSDTHADQRIHPEHVLGFEDYSWPAFVRRVQRWVDTTLDWCDSLPNHRFKKVWIFGLGDYVQGDIHDSKRHTEWQNAMKAALAVGDVFASAVADIADNFEAVEVVSLSGNHPRHNVRGKVDPRTPHENYDYLVAAQLATRLQSYIDDGRVTVHAPDAWSAVVNVRGWNWLLAHGHQIKGYQGIPYYGLERRERRVSALFSARDEKLHYHVCGHFHTSSSLQTPAGEMFMNGSWFWTDDYAFEALGLAGRPFQWAFGVHERRGVSWRLPIHVASSEGHEDLTSECRYDQRILYDLGAVDRSARSGGIPIIGRK